MDAYEKSEKIGAGTYGIVYLATHKQTQNQVALKKVKILRAQEGVSFTAYREIKSLLELHHPNVLALLNVFEHKNHIYLVYELMVTSLEAVIKDKEHVIILPEHTKSYMQMLLQGVDAIHSNWILHRDLKPNNLLMNTEGVLKLADFGLSRQFGSPNARLTSEVVTLWYRAPELIFGAKKYGAGIDMWAVGCIFAELMLRIPFLPGLNDIDQIAKTFQAFGTPTAQQWPDLKALPSYMEFSTYPPTPLKQIFTAASEDSLDLLSKLMYYNPASRLSAADALKHAYFSQSPAPTAPSQLPKPKLKQSQIEYQEQHPSKKRKLEDGAESAAKRLSFA